MDDELSGCLNILGLILSTVALVGWLCTTDVFSRGKPEPKPDDQAECAAATPGEAAVFSAETEELFRASEGRLDPANGALVEDLDGRNDGRGGHLGQADDEGDVEGFAGPETTRKVVARTEGFEEIPASERQDARVADGERAAADVRDGDPAHDERFNGRLVDVIDAEVQGDLRAAAHEPVDEVEHAERETADRRDGNGVVPENLE